MYCPNCGTQNADQAAFCVNCGSPLKNTPGNAATPTPPPPIPPNPNPGYQPYNAPRPGPEDKADTILSIVAFCFPIVGLILYFVWKDSKPNSAKQICTASAIGFGVGVVFYLIMAAAASGL